MSRYLLEDPWPAVVVLACAAFTLLLAGMRRGVRGPSRWLVAAGVVAAAAVGVYVLAATVTTDREHVEQRTRAIVAATAPLDAPALRRLIDPAAAVTFPNGAALPMSLALSDELARAVGRHAVREQAVSGLYAQTVNADTIEVRLNVRSTLDGQAFKPVDTEWLLTWRREGGGDWRVVAVQWLKFENREPTPGLWY